ncbi:Putative zinc protease [hydrothermal vent metagenome]|uniref:Putative zinc protease n=1 Tax=hydrothermal vent metagenome TaxID=652676 RepID=A0A1W1EIJ4_9ZZZZ
MASSLPKHYTKTLDNGLEVVAIPMNNHSGVITTQVYYKVGSGNEIMGKSGIAHMLEHMSFKSTKKMREGEFDEIVKSMGANNNASTGFDYTTYYINSTAKHLSKSLELFADMMDGLLLKDDEFQKERAVVAEERRWRTDNTPTGYLFFRLFNIHYTYHSYHWTPIGFMEDILNWKIEDIREFYKSYYSPNNAIIVVAGDIDKDTVFKEAEAKFGDKKKSEVRKLHFKELKIDGSKRAILHKDNNNLDILAIAYPIPNFENEDQVGLSAITEILSNGKSSKLYKKLVDEKSMVNQVYGYNMDMKSSGIFLFFAVCNPDVKAEAVEKEILDEIEKIKKGSISQEELDKVKINTKADFIHSIEHSHSVAGLFGSYFAKGNIKPLLEYEEKFDKITTKDITAIANKYFDNNVSTTLILRSSK